MGDRVSLMGDPNKTGTVVAVTDKKRPTVQWDYVENMTFEILATLLEPADEKAEVLKQMRDFESSEFKVGHQVQTPSGETGTIVRSEKKPDGGGTTSSATATQTATQSPAPNRDLLTTTREPNGASPQNGAVATLEKTAVAHDFPVFTPGERVWRDDPGYVREGVVIEQLPSGLVKVRWHKGRQTFPVHPRSLSKGRCQIRDVVMWQERHHHYANNEAAA
ncbi:MAG: hypothetical protein F6K35_27805 [Okeania sp. SIO2H7]|nr:hypothetical protein [Okeania sp. SIO2H7]